MLPKNVDKGHMLEIRFRRNRSFQNVCQFIRCFRLIDWDSALTLLINDAHDLVHNF